MPRAFNVPIFYRSPSISLLKQIRKDQDPRKRDFQPSVLDFGAVKFKLARHFGFCFGVENAIDIAYKALNENPGRRIFLLSEMIHNPGVNSDLLERGVKFIMDTAANILIPFSELTAEDIVIVPAFGTTLELQKQLSDIGIDPYYYDTTCPFVEKVWRRAEELGNSEFTIIVHGKRTHEETRATVSHSKKTAPTLVIFNLEDAVFLGDFIKGNVSLDAFYQRFANCISEGFDASKDLNKIGVVNQTTMLATETKEIAETIKQAMLEVYGEEKIKHHFADTRDTLCYATYENQRATNAMIVDGADLGIVVGGYNSSNTSHLVELCELEFPTYYIKDADEILSSKQIRHFEILSKTVKMSENWLPEKRPLEIAITSGASCPDMAVDAVINKVASFFEAVPSLEEALNAYALSNS